MTDLNDDMTVQGASASYFDAPTFPLSVTYGRATVLLKADGTAEGNVEELRAALTAMRGHDVIGGVLVWLLMRTLLTEDR